jgi:uncharacterized protein
MSTAPTATISDAIASRVHELDWPALTAELHEHGFAITNRIYTPQESRDLADLFDGDGFRSTIDMVRHRFGEDPTATSTIRSPTPSKALEPRSMSSSRQSPPPGARACRATTPPSPPPTRSSWSAAARPDRNARPLSSCATT